jgi:type I restriction enzyme M protein
VFFQSTQGLCQEYTKQRDKTSLDIFWLKDKSLTDLDNLPDPDVLATENIENIKAGLESFKGIIEN